VTNIPVPKESVDAVPKDYVDAKHMWEEPVEGDYIERYGNYFVSDSYGGVYFYAIGLPGTGSGTIKILNTAGMYITLEAIRKVGTRYKNIILSIYVSNG
jgi:hypothetical protein